MSEVVKNKGWSVAMAGIGINLALGILYAWSIFKGAIAESIKAGVKAHSPGTWQSRTIRNDVLFVFAFAMILQENARRSSGRK